MSLRDDILDRTDILDLVSRYVQMKKVGKNRAGLCPFHKEKSPSFTVAEDKQIFKCFGCGKGGNAITFHMEIEKTDFRDTMKMLAHDAHIDMTEYEKDPEQVAAKKESKEKFKLLNKRVKKLFQDAFAGSVAHEYTSEIRKLSPTTIETFGLGYASDSHYDLIHQLKEKGFTGEDLITAGLARQSTSGDVYAFFRQRLIFPIQDHIGNVVGFGARALDKDQNPKYLNTTETPLYDKSKVLYGMNIARNHLKERDMLIIVEGYMDVIALHQYGLPIGIATCGTALTAQHTKLISRHTENLLFAFDNDNAGFEAAIRGLKVAYQQDLFPKILEFPTEYKDVDERLTETNQSITKEFLQEHAIDGFSYVLRQLNEQYDLANPVERKKVLRICFEILTHIEDWTILTLYLDQMSRPFGTGTDILLQQFRGFLKKSRTSNFQPYEEEKEKKESGVAPKYLLASLRYDDSLTSFYQKDGSLKKLMEVIQELSDHFSTSLIYHITHNTLEDKEKQYLLEAQLRWEHQFGELLEDKKSHMLTHFLQQQLHVMERIILKSRKISDEDKQEIIKKVREMKR